MTQLKSITEMRARLEAWSHLPDKAPYATYGSFKALLDWAERMKDAIATHIEMQHCQAYDEDIRQLLKELPE